MSSTALLGPGSTAYAEQETPQVEPTDHALVAAVRTGDDRAFEQLFGRYQRRVAAYVYGMVSDHGRAEDITQEIFISALRRMRETERPIAFRPWIYEIAKNACIDQFRRSRRSEEVSYDSAEDLGAADYGRLVQRGPSPDALVDQKQALHDLTGAFGGLSDTHHRILVLRELEGLSYREIGDRLDMTRASVESTLFRARRRLSEEYDDLASGQRCVRVQGLLRTAVDDGLNTRDARRFARHVSHCQACRLQARLAGVDAAVMARRPRRVLGSKIAGLLPFPAFLRGRRDSAEAIVTHWTTLGPAADPLVHGWSKLAAAAATVALAGVGAGVGSQVSSKLQGPDRAVTAPAVERSAPARSSAPIGVRPLPGPGGPQSGGPGADSARTLRSKVPASSSAKRLGGSTPGAGLRPVDQRPKPSPTGPRKRPGTAAAPVAPAAPVASAPVASDPVKAPVETGAADETTSATVPDPRTTAGGGVANPPSEPAQPSAPQLPAPGDSPSSPPGTGLGGELTRVADDGTRSVTTAVGGVSGATGLGAGLEQALIDASL